VFMAGPKARDQLLETDMKQTTRRYERWYERERWAYNIDRNTVKECARWVKEVDWKLFCTFTFAWKVSDQQADKTFGEFINRLERVLKCDIGYVRGDEKRLSGCGKPACGRHFHVLFTSAAPLIPASVALFWMEMAGNRSDDAGAKVEPYNPSRNEAEYVLKFIYDLDGGWVVRKLELFHPEARSLHDMTKRFKRRLQRHKARQNKFNASVLAL
jgi:hypothetical protein